MKTINALDICVGLLLAKFFLVSIDFAMEAIPRIFDVLPRGFGGALNELFVLCIFGAMAIGVLVCPVLILDVVRKKL